MKQKKSALVPLPSRLSRADLPPRFDAEALRNENLLGEKLAAARRALGLSQKAVVERLRQYNINVLPAAFCKWEQGYTLPNVYQFLALCAVMHIDDPLAYFLSCGEPSVRPALNALGMKKLQEYYELLRDSKRYEPSDIVSLSEDEIEKKVFDLPASAGTGLFLDSDAYSLLSFPVSAVPDDAEFGVRVSGDSMLPRYVSGQIAWVKRCTELRNGEIGIFTLNGDAFIKKYCQTLPLADEREEYTDSDGCLHPRVTLVSLNPAYEDIPIAPASDLRVVGRVLN